VGLPVFQAAGSSVSSVTATLALVAPATNIDDVLLANIYTADNHVAVLPQGWQVVQAFNNTVAQRQTVAWYRAAAGDSGKTFNFTVAGTTLAYGDIVTYRGAKVVGSPIGASTQSPNALSDNITFASLTPFPTSLVVALGVYGLNGCAAGTMSPNTDPAFTSRVQDNTATSTTAAMYVQDGPTSGAATTTLALPTTSTVDAINSGVLLEILAGETVAGDASGGASEPLYSAITRLRPDPSLRSNSAGFPRLRQYRGDGEPL
jgi:hypothetical protein